MEEQSFNLDNELIAKLESLDNEFAISMRVKKIEPYAYFISKFLCVPPQDRIESQLIENNVDIETGKLKVPFKSEWIENLKRWDLVRQIVLYVGFHDKRIIVFTDAFHLPGDKPGIVRNGFEYSIMYSLLQWHKMKFENIDELHKSFQENDCEYNILYEASGPWNNWGRFKSQITKSANKGKVILSDKR